MLLPKPQVLAQTILQYTVRTPSSRRLQFCDIFEETSELTKTQEDSQKDVSLQNPLSASNNRLRATNMVNVN
jgi:hypothetical protein